MWPGDNSVSDSGCSAHTFFRRSHLSYPAMRKDSRTINDVAWRQFSLGNVTAVR
ncbi:hypothetical protein AVEN_88069-1, partial [Araneus ventricosus]